MNALLADRGAAAKILYNHKHGPFLDELAAEEGKFLLVVIPGFTPSFFPSIYI